MNTLVILQPLVDTLTWLIPAMLLIGLLKTPWFKGWFTADSGGGMVDVHDQRPVVLAPTCPGVDSPCGGTASRRCRCF